MVLINSSRFGALILNVCISLNPWLAASAWTDPVQASSTVTALVSPNIGSANSSVPAPQTTTSLDSTSSLAIETTSGVTIAATLINLPTLSSPSGSANATATVSTSSIATPFDLATSPALSSTDISLTTSASSISNHPSSSATESSIATFAPGAPPSDAHIAKLAEIIVPSVVGGAGIGAALYHFFGKLAEMQPGESAASVARSLKMARQTQLLDKLSSQQKDWVRFYERRILMEEGRNPGTLTTEQVDSIRAVENAGESIWTGNDIPSLPEPCVGVPFCIDWPGSPPGSAPPSGPGPPSDPNPPPAPNLPSKPNPPSDPEPPSSPNTPPGPDLPPGQNPPSTPNPPSDPRPPPDPNTPPGPDPPLEPNPPPESELPPPATEESIRLANQLPPLPEAVHLNGRFKDLDLVRLVPEEYRTLPLDAKIVYVTKYGEDVWSQRLRYFKGAETAAVDLQNQPLDDWNFDKSGDPVDYKGKSIRDIRKGNLPEGMNRYNILVDLGRISEEISRLQDMEEVERERVSNANPPPESPQPTPTPSPPEPAPSPPEPTPSPPEPTASPPEPTPTNDHTHDHDHDHKHKKHKHRPHHPHDDRVKGGKCILFWNWGKCHG